MLEATSRTENKVRLQGWGPRLPYRTVRTQVQRELRAALHDSREDED